MLDALVLLCLLFTFLLNFVVHNFKFFYSRAVILDFVNDLIYQNRVNFKYFRF